MAARGRDCRAGLARMVSEAYRLPVGDELLAVVVTRLSSGVGANDLTCQVKWP